MIIMNKENEKLICDKYLNGKSVKLISEEIKINRKTIYKVLKRNNINLTWNGSATQKYNDIKYCIYCKDKLTEDNWMPSHKKNNSYRCDNCFNIYRRNFYKNNKNKKIIINRREKLKLYYNLTIEEYNLLLKKANYKCEICGSENKLCVDHNHKLNNVRGILCGTCNSGIGMFKDDIKLLTKAIEYLLEED